MFYWNYAFSAKSKQDGAPAHRAEKTIGYLHRKLGKQRLIGKRPLVFLEQHLLTWAPGSESFTPSYSSTWFHLNVVLIVRLLVLDESETSPWQKIPRGSKTKKKRLPGFWLIPTVTSLTRPSLIGPYWGALMKMGSVSVVAWDPVSGVLKCFFTRSD